MGKAVTIDRLRQHWRSRYTFMDALDGSAISIASDENDSCVAYLSKPPCDLNPFAASFETNVH
jgi:hypothetical protein